MSELPKCKACGCVGIHACMGQPMPVMTQEEKRKFLQKLTEAIKEAKKIQSEHKK